MTNLVTGLPDLLMAEREVGEVLMVLESKQLELNEVTDKIKIAKEEFREYQTRHMNTKVLSCSKRAKHKWK